MTSSKIQKAIIPSERTEDNEISTGELNRLTSAFIAHRKANEKPLNKIELTAVFGLIAYIAHTQKVREDTVCEIMTSHYGINAVAALPSRLYQDAIEYLVDLKMDQIVN